jgi:succinate-semialdehyde dehydrogenase / glutarate-semialdehyde dehydrogenase
MTSGIGANSFPVGLWINGESHPADDGRTFSVSDPATGEVIEQVPLATENETRRAIEAATKAFGTWKRQSPVQRADVLWRIRQLLLDHREALAQLRTAEQGAPLEQARNEVDYAASFFKWFAEEAPRLHGRAIPQRDPQRQLSVEYFPVGVVGAITPWNGPLSSPSKKVAAALAAGCTVVLKPAELTPLSALALAWLTKQAGLPDGVLNVVCGDAHAIGAALLSHKDVRMIAFTGSARTGRYLMSEAGKQLKRVALELGGNAPFIIFADADLDAAVRDLALLKFNNSGQICVTANRILVERSVHDQFLKKMTDLIKNQCVGKGSDPNVTMGPLIHRQALENVASLVEDAVLSGALLVAGTRTPPEDVRTCFYPPTILDNVTPSMRIAREEVFGPVISVLTFDSDEEAVRLANDTPFGLAAYVYTSIPARGQRFAEELEAGVVGINDPRPITAEAPFGGVKDSGIGREGGTEGLLEYLDVRLIGSRFPEGRRVT